MQRIIARPSLDKTLAIIGIVRINLILQNKFPFDRAMDFYLGKSPEFQSNMMGIEFTKYAVDEFLKNRGAKNIRTEVDIGDTKVDILADMEDEPRAYECKCQSELEPGNKAVIQINKYRGKYKNASVLVPFDCKVSPSVEDTINKIGGEITRVDITKEEILERILEIQQILC